ncbi:SDR family NAD(P)-dependent oxidoreductase [Pontibacter cellulosilyticus]|uniref:SDR family oxidoreductase n=1 Tax=Pontibacter cellulosilyticus TaxID=1720253 RepID=A0A923SIM2_9BACT|nr:SDR family oxidoreductase [Pontibacter cellulosilyticus]MBC5992752.1 SDR family oxidoreductase [Pontibacter cellulosilyticus]
MKDTASEKFNVLITGASAGIGKALADIFAAQGHSLVLVARSEEKLDSMAVQYALKYGTQTKVISLDLTMPEAPDRLFEQLHNEGVQVTALINNAGFGNYGYFKETALQKELDMIQLNITALTHLCKLFLNQLTPGRSAKILNVSSTAAFPPAGPLMAVYYASKAYVQSFTEALATELEQDNVTVTALCPGPTETEFQERANLHGSGLFTSQFVADAHSVAQAGYEGMMSGEVVVIPGVQNKLTALTAQLMPRKFVRNLVKRVQEKRG